jgi:hypothetical protein
MSSPACLDARYTPQHQEARGDVAPPPAHLDALGGPSPSAHREARVDVTRVLRKGRHGGRIGGAGVAPVVAPVNPGRGTGKSRSWRR